MLKVYIIKSFKSVYLGLLGLALVLSVGLSGSIVEASTTVSKIFNTDDQIFLKQNGCLDSGLIALFIVFAIVWAGFFLYVFYMSRKSQNLMREIDILKSKLEDRNSEN